VRKEIRALSADLPVTFDDSLSRMTWGKAVIRNNWMSNIGAVLGDSMNSSVEIHACDAAFQFHERWRRERSSFRKPSVIIEIEQMDWWSFSRSFSIIGSIAIASRCIAATPSTSCWKFALTAMKVAAQQTP